MSAVRFIEEFSKEGPLSRPRACLALFEAAEALGIGFVHAAQPYMYVEGLNADVLQELGVSEHTEEIRPDLYIRVPSTRESVFRGAVEKGGVPISDILQVWLDVSQHPARGQEQADLIWRKILAPAGVRQVMGESNPELEAFSRFVDALRLGSERLS
jgi:hypothetical protein